MIHVWEVCCIIDNQTIGVLTIFPHGLEYVVVCLLKNFMSLLNLSTFLKHCEVWVAQVGFFSFSLFNSTSEVYGFPFSVANSTFSSSERKMLSTGSLVTKM